MKAVVEKLWFENIKKWSSMFDFRYTNCPFLVSEEHKTIICSYSTFTDMDGNVRISLYPKEENEEKDIMFSLNSMGKQWGWGETLNFRNLMKNVAECMIDFGEYLDNIKETAKTSGYVIW